MMDPEQPQREGSDATLCASDLAHIGDEDSRVLLDYLNLPPVGCLADGDGPPDLASDAGYELPGALRAAVGERRDAEGGQLATLDQLLDIPGLGPARLRELQTRLSSLGRYGNRLRPVWGGPESQRAFFELLESAESHIHLQTYVVGGETGLRMAEVLARKVAEGVEVRVMFAASGFVISGSPSGTGFASRLSSWRSHLFNDMFVRKRIIQRLREGGVSWRDSSPIARHWKRRDLRRQGVKSARAYERWARERGIPDSWLEEQAHIDRECGVSFAYVDHRKIVVVDGQRAFIGSQNIADSYFYDNELDPDPRVNRKRWQWHDNSTLLEGPSVAELNRLFAMRWMLSGGDMFDWTSSTYQPPPKRVGGAAVTVVPSLPGAVTLPLGKNIGRFLASLVGADRRPFAVGQHPIRDRVLQLPEVAQDELYVEHCYPSDSQLLTHWAERAGRLRDFTMVVPHHYDTKFLGMECDRFYAEMRAAGIDVRGYGRAIMHSKIAVADRFYVATGSYNLTLRSARADLELEFFVQCRDYGRAVQQRIHGDLDECRPIEPSAVDRFRARRSIPVCDALMRFLLM